MKDELVCLGCDLREMVDPRRFLQGRWREDNVRLWFEMVNFLFADRGDYGRREMTVIEMVGNVRQKIM